ncbi:RNA polymerase sigma factor [Novosphingobium sp. SG919]|uniref:sigma-70 family RNA polymerase sigma factor n=1 Tax=unclassified Novosphingobium TaxID=2644732 RepID=UPI0017C26861|nr:RNA polymerase sigma-70 factor (ECF subfamily) [Novosphingobium sp. SG919]NMN87395.1 RNA polymerase sigma-70 factor (ECF subfamily) [Novosphingobium sp. SG916]
MRHGLDQADDAALVCAALAGDEQAYRHLMVRHRQAVYRVAWAQTGQADAALDVTQETFIAAFAALARYDPKRPMRWWLGRIALNKGRDWRRRQAVRRFWLGWRATGDDRGGEELAAQVPDPAPGPEQEAGARAELVRTANAIAGLPAPLREAIVLHGVEGMAQRDIAALLGLSEKAVETRVYRARKRLAQVLGEED